MSDAKPDSPLAQRIYPSPNFGERKGVSAPDCIILHYTGMPTASEALLWLANPLSQVSCHYFVFEDGRIFQLVPESARAWHAGKSCWHGETDINSRSIGIEIVNIGPDLTKNPIEPGNYPDFPDEQIEAVIALVKDIATRWNIRPERILAHSDVAPGRKVDPGERFPWRKLAQHGLGLWPADPSLPGTAGDEAIQKEKNWIATSASPPRNDGPTYKRGAEGMPIRALQTMFARFGYGLEITGVFDQRTEDVVAAFQRHWRPAQVDGVADGETVRLLRALMAQAGG